MHFNQEFLQNLLEGCHTGKKCLEEIRSNNKKMRTNNESETGLICIEAPVYIENQGYNINAYKIESCIDTSNLRDEDNNEFKRADCLFLVEKTCVSGNKTDSSNINSIALLIEIKTTFGPYDSEKKGYIGINRGGKQLESTTKWIEENGNDKSGRNDTLVRPVIVFTRADAALNSPRKNIRLPSISIRGKKHYVELVSHSRTKKADFWKEKFS